MYSRQLPGAKIMTNSHLRLVAPTTKNRTVTPRRSKNADLRTREHLTPDEVEQLIEAAKSNRHGHRDALMVLLAYRHGLRAAEVVDLRWEQVDFKAALLSGNVRFRGEADISRTLGNVRS
jgi:integrase